MIILLDTNIAVRALLQVEPLHIDIRRSIVDLISRGDVLVLSAQVLSETWSLLTRPESARGGYGLDVLSAQALITKLTSLATVLPEPGGLWDEQYRLLVSFAVSGVQTHDCRIAAWCNLNNVDAILTLNPKDFARYRIAIITPTQLSSD